MNKEAMGTGSTVEAAILDACKQLGVTPEQVETEVIKEPSAGALGIFGKSPAQVKVIFKQGPADLAEDFVNKILTKMGAGDFTITRKDIDNGVTLNIDGEDMGFVIGHRGEALDSLQYLASLIANKGLNDYFRVQLNSGTYREKREKTLVALTQKICESALKTGRVNHLEPMNPYERRIIHSTVGEIEGVASWSLGENNDRHVVIGPKHKEGQSGGGRSGFSGRDKGPKKSFSQNRSDFKPRTDRPEVKKEGFKSRSNEEFVPPPRRENKPFVSRSNSAETTTSRDPVKDADDQPLYGKIDI